jgi:hypothetical protein
LILKIWWRITWQGIFIAVGITLLLKLAAIGVFPPGWESVVNRTIALLAGLPASYIATKRTLERFGTELASVLEQK